MKRIWSRLGRKGQTSIEYLLLTVVAISIGIAFKKKIEDYMLTNPNSLLSRSLNQFNSQFSEDTEGRYRIYSLR